MLPYVKSIQKHIEDEGAYSADMQKHLLEIVDEAICSSPEATLDTLIKDVNAAGVYRSKELAKWLGRCLFQFREQVLGKFTPEIELEKLNLIIQGKPI